jgi:hypothetical protein
MFNDPQERNRSAHTKARRLEIENDRSVRLTVPVALTDPDILIISAGNSLSRRDEWTERSLKFDGVVRGSSGVSITVAPKNAPRALRFMDTLVKALRARGHEIYGSWQFKGEPYRFDLREVLGRPQDGSYKKIPTGNLCLKIGREYGQREWHDAKEVKLEDKISRIIAHLEIDLEYAKECALANEKFQDEWRRKTEEKRQIQEHKEKELVNFKLLLSTARRAREAKMIREYLDHVEANSKADSIPSIEFQSWLEWARRKADWYDPITDNQDDLLDEVDKSSI